MTTPSDEAPKRTIEVEIEVPGTPEQVWDAIATGAGITAWFVPAEVDEREGGTITMHFAEGLDSTGAITAWEPTRRFAYEEEWEISVEAGPARLATEFLVETRSGGTCIVRIVSSGFGSGADWDRELDSMESGWQGYLDNLRRYLERFLGLPCSTILVTGNAPAPAERAWSELSGALGLEDARVGDQVPAAGRDGPSLGGVVERVDDKWLTIRTEEPAQGVAMIAAFTWGDIVYTSFHAYLFGDDAPAVAAREEPAWRAWMDERFPSRTASEAGATIG
jgi:uncharacterized protein YndB with AHSA1/START domain